MSIAQVRLSEARPGEAVESITDLYKEIEGMLGRVEHASTHYEVLDLSYDATDEEINFAFQHVVSLLQPSYYRGQMTLADPTLARIDRAMERAKHAFNVLSSDAKRSEYDLCLSSSSPAGATGNSNHPSSASSLVMPGLAHSYSTQSWPPLDAMKPFEPEPERYIEFTHEVSEDNRRKFERFKLSIPVYVTGHDRKTGEWHEMTQTIDVSRIGALLCMRKRIRHRTLLHLALPLPMKLRCHRHCEPSYSVYALVRRVEPPRDGMRVVAVEFVGEHPPAGYIQKPWTTYATRWSGIERRRAERSDISEEVHIDYLCDSHERVSRDVAVAENLSGTGMRLLVKSPPPEFDYVRVSMAGRSLESLATVCNRFVGKDRLERLCLQFIKP